MESARRAPRSPYSAHPSNPFNRPPARPATPSVLRCTPLEILAVSQSVPGLLSQVISCLLSLVLSSCRSAASVCVFVCSLIRRSSIRPFVRACSVQCAPSSVGHVCSICSVLFCSVSILNPFYTLRLIMHSLVRSFVRSFVFVNIFFVVVSESYLPPESVVSFHFASFRFLSFSLYVLSSTAHSAINSLLPAST